MGRPALQPGPAPATLLPGGQWGVGSKISGMRGGVRRCLVLAAVAALAAAEPARAQDRPGPYTVGRDGQLVFGGDVSAALSPPDDDAFFNYTDYELNAIRMARARVQAEWRLGRVTFVGEMRIQSASGIDVPAGYVRWQPSVRAGLTIQAGRIPPVVGAFPRRAYARDTPLFGVPLAYQYLTSLRSDALPRSFGDLLLMRGRGWQHFYAVGSKAAAPGLPLMSTSNWDIGAEASWRHGWFDAAGAVTLGSPAEPVVRETNDGVGWSGRVAARLPAGVTLGVSGARAPWIRNSVLSQLPDGASHPHTQTLLGVDAEWGLAHWLVRSEWLYSRFQIPLIDEPVVDQELRAWSGFVDARYRLLARWQLGVRAEHLGFATVSSPLSARPPTAWDAPVDRVEVGVGFRLTRQLELRGGYQYDWRSGGRVRERGYPIVGFLLWF